VRRQIAIFFALTLAAAIAGAPAQPRAGVMPALASASPLPAKADSGAASDPAGTTISVAPGDSASRGGRVLLDTDVSGGVTLWPITPFAPSPNLADTTGGRRDVAAGNDNCDPGCATAPGRLPFAVGTAAFQVGSFIGDAVAAANYILTTRDTASGGYGTLGMVGMGNFALVAIALIGFGLTRRRDHIPPG